MKYLSALLFFFAQWGVVNSGPTLPPMCRVGDVYISTTTPTMSVCNTTNTWSTLQALTPVMTGLTGNVTSVGNATTYASVVPYALGGIGGCAATSATTGTITVNMTTACVTVTPTGAMQFNASGGVAGQILVFSITTSGASSFTLTWGTNFRKTGTLATGTTTARFFTVAFLCLDGTTWTEIGRTGVQS